MNNLYINFIEPSDFSHFFEILLKLEGVYNAKNKNGKIGIIHWGEGNIRIELIGCMQIDDLGGGIGYV